MQISPTNGWRVTSNEVTLLSLTHVNLIRDSLSSAWIFVAVAAEKVDATHEIVVWCSGWWALWLMPEPILSVGARQVMRNTIMRGAIPRPQHFSERSAVW